MALVLLQAGADGGHVFRQPRDELLKVRAVLPDIGELSW